MRGRTFATAIAMLIASAFALLPAPAAQAAQGEEEPEWCDEYDSRLRFDAVPYVRVGETFTMSVRDGRRWALYDESIDVVATIDGVRTAVPITPNGDSEVKLQAPAEPGRFQVVVSWRQRETEEGWICLDEIEYPVIALDRDKTIGDLELPRVAGTYLWRLAPVGYPPGRRASEQQVRIESLCTVGACDLKIDGRKVPMRKTNVYGRSAGSGWAQCRASDGRVVKRAWRWTSLIVFAVVDTKFDRNWQFMAKRLQGEYRTKYTPTGKTHDRNCRRGGTERWRLTARLL